ncbi:MAG: M3 family metallopeptidase, partial [Thaumarchaeota archaeon]|nr:M3 family metallopeptidase [Nitrososphaerota archaeon]
MSLDYEALPRDYPRRFVPFTTDLTDWNQIGRYFDELRVRELGSVQDLQRWLDDYSEVFIAMSEAASIRYVRMTEQTDREDYRDAYLAFVENIEPKVKVAQFKLNRKLAESQFRAALQPENYLVLQRKIENSLRLFRDENVELEKEEKKRAQQQQSVAGSMTVAYDGRERTMPEMAKYLELPDRARREESWRLTQGRMARDRDSMDEIFDDMLKLRDGIARNAGFENYRDYSFVAHERFDYGPEDCFRFHDAVEKSIVPLVREVQ